MNIIKSLIIILSLSFFIYAGSHSSVLIGGGLNMSSSNADATGVDKTMRIGFNAGADFEAWINDNFSIIPGLSLETRGENYEMDFMGMSMDTKMKFLYLQIPILFQANLAMGSGWLNVFAGPECGFLVSKGGEANDQDIESDDIDMKGFDFGISAGIGVELPVGPGAICIRPSYYLGLTNAGEDDSATAGVDESEDTKHRNIKIRVAFKIPVVK